MTESNSGPDNEQESTPPRELTNTPFDLILNASKEHQFTGKEIADTIAALINLFREKQPQMWEYFLQHNAKFFAMLGSEAVSLSSSREKDPHEALEESYQDLQSMLRDLRLAVAQAIATEKHLERTIQKNKDQAETWVNRAKLAEKQRKTDLHNEAMERAKKYQQAAEELSKELEEQRQTVIDLRARLTSIEREVQKAYTKKEILNARGRAAYATMQANEVLAKFNTEKMEKALARAEEEIQNTEHQLAQSEERLAKPTDDVNAIDETELSFDSNKALAEAIKSLNRLEARLSAMLDRAQK